MKTVLVFSMLSFFLTSTATGQSKGKSPTGKFLAKRGYTFPGNSSRKRSDKWPDTLYYNTTYRAAILGSPTIPFTLSRIELVNGQYQITPTVSVGLGYTWFFGHFIFGENDKIIVDPTLFFGLMADVGLQNNFSLKQRPTGFFTGGFIGSQAFSIFAGYEFVAHSPSIGIGLRIDVFTISQKTLRPIGRVRELRRHKRIARPIDDD
jgi:hypothetical protein